jgi:predicted Zn-dependent peptidase
MKRQIKDVGNDNTDPPRWRAPAQTHPDAYPLEMLTNILSEGRSSRLYKRLVDQEQVAIGAEAFAFLLEKAGLVGVLAGGLRTVTLDQLDKLIGEEVEAVRKNGVTEDEYQKARNQKEAEFATAFGTMHSRAQHLAN